MRLGKKNILGWRALMISILVISVPGFASPPPPDSKASIPPVESDCSDLLIKPKIQQESFFNERRVLSENGFLKFSDDNIRYFKAQREYLRQLSFELKNRLFETEHADRREFLSRMLGGAPVYKYGDPGSAKSEHTFLIQNTPSLDPFGNQRIDVFTIQLNQMMGDALIRGYVDPLKLKKEEMIQTDDIQNKGSMVHFSDALIDEIDKGNPVALAALLDILNERVAQYGPVTVKVRTRNVVATSNMTVYEFVKIFSEQGMESTARALLDRMPFKVFMPNYITRREKRLLAIERFENRMEQAELEALANPEWDFSSMIAKPIQRVSPMPRVDFAWFGKLVRASTVLEEDALQVLEEVTDKTRSALYGLRRASEKKFAEDQTLDARAVYYPPTIFSTRNILKYGAATIRSGVILDLLTLPENELSTERLVKLLEKKIPINRFSVWRVQDVYLTAAPGDPVIKLAEDKQASVSHFDLEYGPEIDDLLKEPFDNKQKEILLSIKQEREKFKSIYRDVMKSNQIAQSHAINALADLVEYLGPSASPSVNIEEYLFRMNHKRK